MSAHLRAEDLFAPIFYILRDPHFCMNCKVHDLLVVCCMLTFLIGLLNRRLLPTRRSESRTFGCAAYLAAFGFSWVILDKSVTGITQTPGLEPRMGVWVKPCLS